MGRHVKEEANLEIDSSTLGMSQEEAVEQLRRKLEALGLDVEVHTPETKEDN